MARDNRAFARANRNMNAIVNGINDNMDALYRNTYMSTPQQSKDLQNLYDKINASIDDIVANTVESIGQTSISKLYTRIADSGRDVDRSIVNGIESFFDNGLLAEDIYGLLTGNKYLKELDTEIDTVCKYMPELEETLDVQKDCVLSADHFSKDFLSFNNVGSSIEPAVFSERCKDLKKKYKLQELVEDIYYKTAKYGEVYVYRVPYSIAIGRLLATKPNTELVSPRGARGFHESTSVNESEYFVARIDGSTFSIASSTNTSVVTESAFMPLNESTNIKDGKDVTEPILGSDQSMGIALEICNSNIIESAVRDYEEIRNKRGVSNRVSMASIYEASILNESDKKNIQAKGNIDMGSTVANYANDGLIVGTTPEPVKVDCYGCVVKKLDRELVIPIYIEDICMGYYYFEIKTMNQDSDIMTGFKNLLGDPLTNIRNGYASPGSINGERQNEAIMYIASQISKFIDSKFVNHNQDLSREIYSILKCNDMFNSPYTDILKVVFIPPEDMVHFKFRMDDKTHRGISDLDKSLIPAKIYSSLYVTDSLGHLTRGQDKRVYYVKQTVDTNIAQTLLNTISQIKQSNFGIRQFQNINNVLNITGRFNDYVIPMNSSGEAPVQFEVMPGQDIKTPTELMENLKEMAVNATGIPIEIIHARQSVDYAMQLTMSSSKVLRWCYKRQDIFQDYLSDLVTSIYNYEYNEHTEIKVTLPPPSFINVTNTNQLIDNTRNFVQSIIDVEMQGEQDEALKAEYFKSLFNHYLGTHLDVSSHKNILERCKIELKKKQKESHATGNEAESDY